MYLVDSALFSIMHSLYRYQSGLLIPFEGVISTAAIYIVLYIFNRPSQEKLNIYPYVNGITHTNGGRLINVHERIAIVT